MNFFQFIDLKPFLHPSEVAVLDKILAIARDYKYLKDFIQVNYAAIFGEKEGGITNISSFYSLSFHDINE